MKGVRFFCVSSLIIFSLPVFSQIFKGAVSNRSGGQAALDAMEQPLKACCEAMQNTQVEQQ